MLIYGFKYGFKYYWGSMFASGEASLPLRGGRRAKDIEGPESFSFRVMW
jgi:hypothetical protein